MIHVSKDYNDIPRVLLAKKTEKALEKVLNGVIKHAPDIYKHKEVENRLQEIYHGKCAYCESKLMPGFSPVIEHIRPKSIYPWLVYEWSNLIPVCMECNKKNKHYPIEGEVVAKHPINKKDWRYDILSLQEKPLLLNPEYDNPEEHLSFFPDGRIYGLTEQGKVTIDILKLNREPLVIERNKIRLVMNEFLDILTIQFKDIQKAKIFFLDELEKRTDASYEYALFRRYLYNNIKTIFFDTTKNVSFKQKTISPNQLVEKIDLKIKKLSVKNVKCFEEALLNFNKKNTVFLGINGRGKTTILQLIAIAISNIVRPMVDTEWRNVIKNIEIESELEIELAVIENKKEITHKLKYEITTDDKAILISNNEERKKSEQLIKKIQRDFLFAAYGSSRNENKHNSDLRMDENFKNISTLFGMNNNKEYSDYLTQGKAFEQIQVIITKIFNNAEELKNRVILSSYREKTFYFKTATNTENEIPFKALSAGFKTSFRWILDMIIRAWEKNFDIDKPESIHGIVLIDEIDTHLHIKWQKTILRTLHDIFPKIQFIVTTHSPFVIQSVSKTNIFLLKLEDENIITELVDIEEGTSSKHIITDVFESTSIFNKEIEEKFDDFNLMKEEIINNTRTISDNEFEKIVKNLSEKGEEVRNILRRELRQLQFILQK